MKLKNLPRGTQEDERPEKNQLRELTGNILDQLANWYVSGEIEWLDDAMWREIFIHPGIYTSNEAFFPKKITFQVFDRYATNYGQMWTEFEVKSYLVWKGKVFSLKSVCSTMLDTGYYGENITSLFNFEHSTEYIF